MSDFICDCPLEDGLPDLTDVTCAESFGLVGKLAFARVGEGFLDITDYDTESSWDTRIAASDNTEITISPLVQNPVSTSGTPITFGGNDNTTNSGAQIITGESFSQMVVQFYDLPMENYKELYEYQCVAAAGQLAIYFIGNGWSWYNDGFTGIPVQNAFIQSIEVGGRVAPNAYTMTIDLPAGWQLTANYFKHVNFNPQNLTNA